MHVFGFDDRVGSVRMSNRVGNPCYDSFGMYATLAIVLAIRIVVPLSIFRWPLWGSVACAGVGPLTTWWPWT